MRYGGPRSTLDKFDKSYVSEFTEFIKGFLESHPEEEEEQREGRALYWDHKVDLSAQDKADKDSVPDDRYGFDYSAWRGPSIAKQGGPEQG